MENLKCHDKRVRSLRSLNNVEGGRTSSARYLEYQVMSQLRKGTEAERESAGVIKFELAILQQRTTLSKLSNGVLDVAQTLPFSELRTHL